MNAAQLQQQLSSAALPELVEVDGNFIRRDLATTGQIEDALIRSVGRLRHLSATDPAAPELYTRITSLWKLRVERNSGVDDGWVGGLISAIGANAAPPASDENQGPDASVFDQIRAEAKATNEVNAPRDIDAGFGRVSSNDPFTQARQRQQQGGF